MTRRAGASTPTRGESLVEITLPSKAAADPAPAQRRALRRRVQRPLPAHEPRRLGHRDRLRHEDELTRLEAGGLRARCRRSRARRRGRPARRAPGRDRSAERDGPTRRRVRQPARPVPHGRDRRPARRLLRELRRPVPVGRGEDRQATVEPSGTAYTGPALSLSFNGGAGTPIDSPPRDDERRTSTRTRRRTPTSSTASSCASATQAASRRRRRR